MAPAVYIDIDECTMMLDDCSEHASCTNVIGSFACNCLDGFTGDGTVCTGLLFCINCGIK